MQATKTREGTFDQVILGYLAQELSATESKVRTSLGLDANVDLSGTFKNLEDDRLISRDEGSVWRITDKGMSRYIELNQSEGQEPHR